MKIMARNARRFWYCLYGGRRALKDADGYETGESRVSYLEPVMSIANISPASGAAQTEQFGTLDGYDKVIVTDDTDCPIDENTVLFVDREPEFDDRGEPVYDYIVRRVARSLNSVSIAVQRAEVS